MPGSDRIWWTWIHPLVVSLESLYLCLMEKFLLVVILHVLEVAVHGKLSTRRLVWKDWWWSGWTTGGWERVCDHRRVVGIGIRSLEIDGY